MHALAPDRSYVCDILPGETFLMTPDCRYWTTDPIPQPCHAPQYVGGFINPASRRITGGRWVDPQAPTAAEVQARQPNLPREHAKAQRQIAVAGILVTTAAGKTFQGDEKSQERMARQVVALSAQPPGTLVNWTLANNESVEVSATELSEALQLALDAQSELWTLPR